jgi:hypothetical protein
MLAVANCDVISADRCEWNELCPEPLRCGITLETTFSYDWTKLEGRERRTMWIEGTREVQTEERALPEE